MLEKVLGPKIKWSDSKLLTLADFPISVIAFGTRTAIRAPSINAHCFPMAIVNSRCALIVIETGHSITTKTEIAATTERAACICASRVYIAGHLTALVVIVAGFSVTMIPIFTLTTV